MEPTEQEKRDAIRKALLEKYQATSGDTSLVDDAQERASNVGIISGIGQALEGIARSGAAPYGDKGPDLQSYQNMRNSAQQGVKDAQSAQESRQRSALQAIDINRGMEGDARGDRGEARDVENQAYTRQKAVEAAILAAKNRDQDVGFKSRELGQGDRKLDISQQEADQAAAKTKALAAGGTALTQGQVAADKDFAKKNNDWVSGGRQTAEKSLARLTSALNELKTTQASGIETVSGNIQGRLPDALRSKKGREIESVVNESALAAIKSIVGSQAVSDADVRNVLKSWYDPTLDESQNAAKLQSNIEALTAQMQAKNAQAKQFAQTGSVAGFGNAPQQATPARTVTSRQYSASRNQTKLTYSDGTSEIVEGQP